MTTRPVDLRRSRAAGFREWLGIVLTAGACMLALPPADAQTDPTVFAEQEKRVRASGQVRGYGPDLFGDSINLYTGKLQFTQTDIAVPGNSALPVEVRRVLSVGDNSLANALFGDWDLDLPSIRGTFAVGPRNAGWAINAAAGSPDAYKRCTYFGEPAEARPTLGLSWWMPWEYWFGTTLNAPNGGELLFRGPGNTAAPATGHSWPLVTRSGWQLRCLASLHSQNLDSSFNQGEGFIAVDPIGNQYRFDWMVQRPAIGLDKWRGRSLDRLPRAEFLLFPTEVTDRHGNWVRYNFNPSARSQLQNITASDGRSIGFAYDSNNRITSASVSDGVRTLTWSYGYADGFTVTQPDGSRWQMRLEGLRQIAHFDGDPACGSAAFFPVPTMGTMTHPSGATASFSVMTVRHGRKVSTTCSDDRSTWYPKNFGVRALTSKTLSGPGMASATWQYQYDTSLGSEPSCITCPNTKTVRVTDPRGFVTRHTYGIVSLVNEGQLLQLDEGWNGTSALRTTTYRYRDKAAGPYPNPAGYSPNPRSDSLQSQYHTPLEQRVITQQGLSFSWQASSFDTFARPLRVTRSSGLGAKTETLAWHDATGKWLLGQLRSVIDNSGLVQEFHEYEPATGNRSASHQFGLLKERFSYNTDGTLYQRLDPLGRATTYSNYRRGIAQTISHPDSNVDRAVVNGIGLVTSSTNSTGTTTSYGYDTMGRLSSTAYPGEPGLAYHPTTQIFEPVNGIEYGLAAGHWRQTVATGNARTVRYFDALWRERIALRYDATNPGATSRVVETRYDADGRKTFVSTAQRSLTAVDSVTLGTAWAYDALGRLSRQYQDSELGLLTTSTDYLGGFQKQVTNPRGFVSTYGFQAFDTPGEDAISNITAPGGVAVAIVRDVFGKPLSITRSGGGASATRSWVYDAYQRLCKTVEPESGATVQAYDSAGNIAWRASGLALPGTSQCDQASVPAARMLTYAYDARDRLASTLFGDASPAITRSYTADGLPLQVASAGSTWTYGYNNRRVLTSEVLSVAGSHLAIGWGIDAHGHRASLAYPDGAVLSFTPDALGQPTQVSGYASAITHHPDGTVAGYTLANGVAHSLVQNSRGLPQTWRDAGVLQDLYAYDANGNVTAVSDQQEGVTSRSMGYDGLDRLTVANGLWGAGSYTYDALDNLRSSAVGGRVLSHNLDAATNRLASLSGSQSIGLAYDPNGNLTQRGAQAFVFDIGNRLLSATGKASYTYDGHGRRFRALHADGSSRIQVYSQDGQLLFGQHSGEGNTRQVYLGQRLIAETNSLTGTTFVHTDALGSPVARSGPTGALLSRTRYEPYGATAAGTHPTGIGFTGHVNDPNTGLVYMQQRYYDPIAGRFLSADPVTTDAKTGGHFNRYVYAENNPYKYRDPDGRAVETPWDAANVVMGAVSLVRNLTTGNLVGAAVDTVGIVIDVAATATPGLPGGAAAAIQATRTADRGVDLTVVIGRQSDLAKPGALKAGEKKLEWEEKADAKRNWKENSGQLRQAMSRGKPIGDASPGEKGGAYLPAERNLLEYKGWNFDSKTNLWKPPQQ